MSRPTDAAIRGPLLAVATLLERLPGPQRWLEWGAAALSLALVIALVVATTRRNSDFRTELTIWQDAATKQPGNPRALLNFGDALQGPGADQEPGGSGHAREQRGGGKQRQPRQ